MEKIYRLTGLDSAVEMLRPSAKWEITNHHFSKWDDDRPQPSMEEVKKVQKLAKEFEDKLDTIWTKEQLKELRPRQESTAVNN
jgi:hypothetical protein|tara:strand:+ start:51 stop:299 length:249 start_codon:yes stop_codon:yes gene_type:complete